MTAPYTTLPGGNQSPFSSTPGLPMGSSPGSNPFTSEQQMAIENAVHENPDLSGIWDTIKNAGGDVWGVVSQILPKSADGSIDWGKLGSNIFGFIKDNAPAILSALSAVNSYQRQGKADQYAQQALKLAQQSYDAKAPLRAAGQAGMLNPHAGTPDLSALSAQGQRGASIQAPLPLAAPQTAYQNAASVAGDNPFTKGLPMAPAPVSGTPNVPGQSPGGPSAGPSSFTPKPPTPLPLGPPGQLSPTPAPLTPPAPGQGRSVYDGPKPPPAPTIVPPLTPPAPGQGRSVYDGPNNGQPTPTTPPGGPPPPTPHFAPAPPPIPAPAPGQGRSVYGGPTPTPALDPLPLGQPAPSDVQMAGVLSGSATAPGAQMAGVLNGSAPAPGNSFASAIGYTPTPVPQALQLAPQSGAIANGPQNRTLPTFPTGLPRYSAFSPLPLAGS